ncbi:MAG: hypothetical protein E7661_03150 [Ruminococcaceae bacterium]|nr:hypothetical protein [Oscillospiraceae bacterium]
MKSATIKLLCLLLTFCMLIPFASCGVNEEGKEKGTADGAGSNAETEEARTPHVAKANYDEEFVALYCADTFKTGYYFVDPENREEGNDLDDNIYEREILVEDYLGVKLECINGGDFQNYTNEFKATVGAGDDSFQMLMTHVYMGISGLITSNYLLDMNELDESLNLEADYWNSQLMEDLSINGKTFMGYNDFCLSQTYLVVFNKEMYEPYAPTTGNLYDSVRNKEWTLDKMVSVASLVQDSADNPERKYGFSCFAWVPLSSFVTASDLKIADKDPETGELYVCAAVDSTEKLTNLHEKIYALCNAEYTYAWGPANMKKPTEALSLTSNRVLMSLEGTFGLVSYKGEDIKTGILPYPKYDAAQENYQHMNWNGMLTVSSCIKNKKMVGDVMEMLAFYTNKVKTSFYETLLGAKVADAPEDAEMLELIWSTTVSDLGLVFSDLSNNMDSMVYFIPQLVTAHDQSETASFLKSNAKPANRALERFYDKVG